MKTRKHLFLALALGLTGCLGQDDQGTQDDSHEEQSLGTLSLSLVGTGSDGAAYRLRNAEFELARSYYYWDYADAGAPAPSEILSTEQNPDAATITKRVLPGDYSVSLRKDDWYLERSTSHGYERVEQAVLLSQRSQYVYVYDGSVSHVAFRFGVDGQQIDFRHGDIEIGIEIERPGDNHYNYDGGVGPVVPPVPGDAQVPPPPVYGNYDAGVY